MKSGQINIWIISEDAGYIDLIRNKLGLLQHYNISGVFKKPEKIFLADSGTLPDIIIYDFISSGKNKKVISKMCAAFSGTRILVAVDKEDLALLYEMVCKGVYDYMVKGDDLSILPGKLDRMLTSGTPLESVVGSKIEQVINLHPINNFGFTIRELEIMELLIGGKTKKDIAARLGLSYHTIDSHIRNIYKKLEVKSKSEAISKYLKEISFV